MGQHGVTITKIFYASYTSYEQCKEILADLRRLGMVTYNEETKSYRVTAKGEHYMQIYSVLRNQLGEQDEEGGG